MATPTTLADLLRAGYTPPTESALADPIAEHFRTLPQQIETNQRAMDKTMGGMYKTDLGTGQPNPNYYPEAMGEFTQMMPNVMGSVQKIANPVAKALMSEFVPSVKAGEEMLVMHNLSPEKLYAAEKLGGMPAPSLAISKTESPIKGFGDISLIGGKEMAIPSKTNLAFKSDAYTKTSPSINYLMDYKSEDNLKKVFDDVKDKIHNGNYDLNKLTEDFGRRNENKLLEAKFLDEKGILPNLNEYSEKYKQSADIRDLINQHKDEFDNWAQNFDQSLPSLGVNVKEKIFKGYTPSGNRRYADVNLENIVKEMKGGASSEGFDYGVGNLRALATPKFKNIEEIKNSRGRIIGNEEFGALKDQASKNYYSIIDKLKGINNYDARDALLEVVESKNINALDRMYPNLPKELKPEISAFINDLKQMPTEYFEVKPQRAVGIGEFKGALVPKDLPSKARDVLERAGIKDIYTYANAEERKALTKKFGKEMFVGLPAIPAVMPDDKKKTRQDVLAEQLAKKRVE